jgi:hypothetical protein
LRADEDAVNALPKSLSYVGRRDEYLPESRNDDIQVIAEWLENPDQVAFWMRGGAGLGKSTLAHKIVHSLRADDRLATFAFLLHGSSSDPATVIVLSESSRNGSRRSRQNPPSSPFNIGAFSSQLRRC